MNTIQKTALITGISGQDGSYLAELLNIKGYRVFGFSRNDETNSVPMGTIVRGDLANNQDVGRAIEISKPDEIYNLGAVSDLGTASKFPEMAMDVNYKGVGYLVKQATHQNPNVRIFQASSAQMFEETRPPQNEDAPLKNNNIYAETKIKAYQEFVKGYRDKGFFVCSGFLFNHESPRRDTRFVTRKITSSLVRIKLGLQDCLELGNLDSRKDWSFAGDLVRAMWMMLQANQPHDYVLASGESHSVQDFINMATEIIDMPIQWQGDGFDRVAVDKSGRIVVKVNPNFYRPEGKNYLMGDISRIKKDLGWQPEVSFRQLIRMMIEKDFRIVSGLS